MPGVFSKLNLKEQREIVVLDAPDSFEAELQALRQVKVLRAVAAVEQLTFALAFATRKSQIDRLSRSLDSKATGDAVLWFAYPKASSKRFKCDFNRDNGWDVIREAGWDSVRQVAIDEDWSALRFRRRQFINRRSQLR
jgi:hypothetical protein